MYVRMYTYVYMFVWLFVLLLQSFTKYTSIVENVTIQHQVWTNEISKTVNITESPGPARARIALPNVKLNMIICRKLCTVERNGTQFRIHGPGHIWSSSAGLLGLLIHNWSKTGSGSIYRKPSVVQRNIVWFSNHPSSRTGPKQEMYPYPESRGSYSKVEVYVGPGTHVVPIMCYLAFRISITVHRRAKCTLTWFCPFVISVMTLDLKVEIY